MVFGYVFNNWLILPLFWLGKHHTHFAFNIVWRESICVEEVGQISMWGWRVLNVTCSSFLCEFPCWKMLLMCSKRSVRLSDLNGNTGEELIQTIDLLIGIWIIESCSYIAPLSVLCVKALINVYQHVRFEINSLIFLKIALPADTVDYWDRYLWCWKDLWLLL